MTEPFAAPPDPSRASTPDDIAGGLRSLKVWAGDPSYDTIKNRINAAWTAAGRPGGELARRATVADCFKAGRRRLNTDLVIAVVEALHPDVGYAAQWRQALRVVAGEAGAASRVRVQGALPPDLTEFSGRKTELDRLLDALRQASRDGGAVVLSGMAGVGKTRLAVRAGHLLGYDDVLFVDLLGFHPDPAQPPVDPSTVLDGFLRLLGMPGHRIPPGLPARIGAYRHRLAGTRTLVVLDNAGHADQVRPLLTLTAGCPVLVTSRHSLAELSEAVRLPLDTFTAEEAQAYLAAAAADTPIGPSADAVDRIVRRCGHLPLGLGLIAAQIRAAPGWTLSDHADRLDDRHRRRRLDSAVELALGQSYQRLPGADRRLLRLAALHPGQDLDAYAAAALLDADLATARESLTRLHHDHVLEERSGGRYGFHDLVRAYATERMHDEDAPPDERAALTRLLDYYLAAAGAAAETLYSGGTIRRRTVRHPADTPMPVLDDPAVALAWFDIERPALVASIEHAAAHGWPRHAVRLAAALFRYLNDGHHADARVVHGHACRAAEQTGDRSAQVDALTDLAATDLWAGRYEPAVQGLRRAANLSHAAGDVRGEARARYNLGNIEVRRGRYRQAAGHFERGLTVCRAAGDEGAEAWLLAAFAVVEMRLGRVAAAAEDLRRAVDLGRRRDDPIGTAFALNDLGLAEAKLGRLTESGEHLRAALALHRQSGSTLGEGSVRENLGELSIRLGRPAEAAGHFRAALEIYRAAGDRDSESWALNGLGEAALARGQAAEALGHHDQAYAVAAETDNRDQQARAEAGRGHSHRLLARRHLREARALYQDMGMPDADLVQDSLTTVEGGGRSSIGRAGIDRGGGGSGSFQDARQA